MLPLGLAVSLLQHWGVIAWLTPLLTPAFSLVGLPGESAVVFISSILLNIYAAIAVIATLPMTMREVTILALMCLISHNMVIETTIQRKAGSSALGMGLLRLTASFIAAAALNAMLPDLFGTGPTVQPVAQFATLGAMLADWLVRSFWLILKITVLITALMILQNLLKEFKVLDRLSAAGAPLMRIMGLTRNCSFLWFVAQILGLAYGAAILIESVRQKEIRLDEANLLNYHTAINHSLLEDTLLFVAIGVPVFWITVPRVVLAMLVVWGVHGVVSLRHRYSRRAGNPPGD